MMDFVDPEKALRGGFDVHVYFDEKRSETALFFYNNYLKYLASKGITPTFSSYSKKTDGPHIGPHFSIQLMGTNPTRDIPQEGGAPRALFCISYAMVFAYAYLPLDFKFLVHPNSAKPFGDVAEEILDHTRRAAWMHHNAHTPHNLTQAGSNSLNMSSLWQKLRFKMKTVSALKDNKKNKTKSTD